jgi:16S rRNA (adenine1518-N6/adenine1519-N6)-dimethyltransferase
VRQKLGQHFLRRKGYLERIATAACQSFPRTVVEIGAGKGALTEFLLGRAGRVIAIELDRRLTEKLRERFASDTRLTIVEADILQTDLSQWGPVAVAGNLPYYIASPVIEQVLRLGKLLITGVFLVQREVAARLTAGPGSRDYGLLSVQTQLFASVEILFAVPRTAFDPPPKVDSAVVRFTPREAPVEDVRDSFLGFARACFRHKRKTLRNNLGPVYGRAVDELAEASLRAEQLSLEELLEVYERLRR